MATDFTALKAAVSGRGFSRLSTADQGIAVNDAVHELDGMEPRWPYLLTSTTGTAPLSITDLGDVTNVLNTVLDVQVPYSDYEDLTGWAGELTQTAVDPRYWYFTPGSTTSISTFPVTTRTLQVVYYKATLDLSNGTDEPLCPERWRHLLKDMAVRNAHVMKSIEVPPSLDAAIQRKTERMRTDLHYRQVTGPAMVMPSGYEDY